MKTGDLEETNQLSFLNWLFVRRINSPKQKMPRMTKMKIKKIHKAEVIRVQF